MALLVTNIRKLRDTAHRNSKGEWDWDEILNRELYPAINSIRASITIINETVGFQVFDLTGASNDLVTDYIRSYVRVANASATVFNIPSSADFLVGDWVRLIQSGAGVLTVVAGAGVTINFPETLVMYKQWGTATLINVAADTWDFDGDTELA